MGNVLQAGLGQNPTRQAALKAGIPQEIPSWTLDKVCGFGLKAVVCAAQSIIAGDAEIIIAGGMENMSLDHYTLPRARVDTMVHDGLTDAVDNIYMGVTAENIAKQNGFSREEQDRYSVSSQNRTETAIKAGRFEEEGATVSGDVYLQPLRELLLEAEKHHISEAIERTSGNHTHAAKLLQISRRALLYKIHEHNLG